IQFISYRIWLYALTEFWCKAAVDVISYLFLLPVIANPFSPPLHEMYAKPYFPLFHISSPSFEGLNFCSYILHSSSTCFFFASSARALHRPYSSRITFLLSRKTSQSVNDLPLFHAHCLHSSSS